MDISAFVPTFVEGLTFLNSVLVVALGGTGWKLYTMYRHLQDDTLAAKDAVIESKDSLIELKDEHIKQLRAERAAPLVKEVEGLTTYVNSMVLEKHRLEGELNKKDLDARTLAARTARRQWRDGYSIGTYVSGALAAAGTDPKYIQKVGFDALLDTHDIPLGELLEKVGLPPGSQKEMLKGLGDIIRGKPAKHA